jgi:RNA-directed DNA polymerase
MTTAYAWLCKQRRDYPDAADIWSFRTHWPAERARLCEELIMGRYRLSVLTRVTLQSGDSVDLWAARDALLLKCLTLVLSSYLPRSDRCFHLKSEGENKKGVKAALQEIQASIADRHFVFRTDVHSYYASIAHTKLMAMLSAQIADVRLLDLLAQYLARTAEQGGLFWHYARGIPLACSLSPLLGGFFLYNFDIEMTRSGWFYLRYMDDVLVLTSTRNHLRQAVQKVNQLWAELDLKKHPDKTFIGRIERGFTFLGREFP